MAGKVVSSWVLIIEKECPLERKSNFSFLYFSFVEVIKAAIQPLDCTPVECQREKISCWVTVCVLKAEWRPGRLQQRKDKKGEMRFPFNIFILFSGKREKENGLMLNLARARTQCRKYMVYFAGNNFLRNRSLSSSGLIEGWGIRSVN